MPPAMPKDAMVPCHWKEAERMRLARQCQPTHGAGLRRNGRDKTWQGDKGRGAAPRIRENGRGSVRPRCHSQFGGGGSVQPARIRPAVQVPPRRANITDATGGARPGRDVAAGEAGTPTWASGARPAAAAAER